MGAWGLLLLGILVVVAAALIKVITYEMAGRPDWF